MSDHKAEAGRGTVSGEGTITRANGEVVHFRLVTEEISEKQAIEFIDKHSESEKE